MISRMEQGEDMDGGETSAPQHDTGHIPDRECEIAAVAMEVAPIAPLQLPEKGTGRLRQRRSRKMRVDKFDLANMPLEGQEAQRLERERLQRIEKSQQESLDIFSANGRQQVADSCDTEEKDENSDDVHVIGEVKQVIELSSDEEPHMQQNTHQPSTSKPAYANNGAYTHATRRVRPVEPRSSESKEEARWRKRRRVRKDEELDEAKLTQEGKLLVNQGRPCEDPEVYVAQHLTHALKPHQIGGVRFLYDNVIESLKDYPTSHGFGCVLAHVMGLGKTLQVITFVEILLRVTSAKKVLILCPVNTVMNWKDEFDKWLPEKTESGECLRPFPVHLLSDSVRSMEARSQVVEEWRTGEGVLLLGYEMLRQMVQLGAKTKTKKKVQQGEDFTQEEMDAILQPSAEEVEKNRVKSERNLAMREALLNPGPDMVVCDEGHRIKNLNSETAQVLKGIHTKRRVVLTGSPLQNNLMEYYCMIDFVRPQYLGNRKTFSSMFEAPIKKGQCKDSTAEQIKLAKQRIHVLVGMLKGFVQRRSQHILKKILPENKEYVLILRMSPIQRSLYQAFVNYAHDAGLKKGTVFNPIKAHHICSKILHHPDLLYDFVGGRRHSTAAAKDNQDAMDTLGNFPPGEVLETQPCGVMQGCGGKLTAASLSSNGVEEQPFAGNVPITFPSYGEPFGEEEPWMMAPPHKCFSNISLQGDFQPWGPGYATHSDYNGYFFAAPTNADSYPSLSHPSISYEQQPPILDYYGSAGNPTPPLLPRTYTGGPEDSCKRSVAEPSLPHFGQVMPKNGASGMGNYEKQVDANYGQGAESREEPGSIGLEWAEPLLVGYESGRLENGTKFLVAMRLIAEVAMRGEKMLLFSSSIPTLNLLEHFLTREPLSLHTEEGSAGAPMEWRRDITYCRFDGSTSGSDRQRLIKRFNEDKDLRLFLISTKAGSLGINLVSATRVLVFDCSWNPSHDTQAVCRVYRYGQKQRTYTYRLIMHNSMERAIFSRQISKHSLQPGISERVIDEQNIESSVTLRELENLLGYDSELDTSQSNVEADCVDDELLKNTLPLLKEHLAEAPFLHESLLQESEAGLSEQEKLEAQLFYEQEICGQHRPPIFTPPLRHTLPQQAWPYAQAHSTSSRYTAPLPPPPPHSFFTVEGDMLITSLSSRVFLLRRGDLLRQVGSLRWRRVNSDGSEGEILDATTARQAPIKPNIGQTPEVIELD